MPYGLSPATSLPLSLPLSVSFCLFLFFVALVPVPPPLVLLFIAHFFSCLLARLTHVLIGFQQAIACPVFASCNPLSCLSLSFSRACSLSVSLARTVARQLAGINGRCKCLAESISQLKLRQVRWKFSLVYFSVFLFAVVVVVLFFYYWYCACLLLLLLLWA